MSAHLNPEPFERELRRVERQMRELNALPVRYVLDNPVLEGNEAASAQILNYEQDVAVWKGWEGLRRYPTHEPSRSRRRPAWDPCGCLHGRCTGHKVRKGGPVNVLSPELLAQRQHEIREDAERNRPMCSSSRCSCGGVGKDCTWWKARNACYNNTTDPAVIAQQLWQESRELLAKVGVELPTAPPPPVTPVRWHRRPLVRRFVFFGAAPALAFLALFYALTGGQVLLGGPVVVFLWGAFITYETALRTNARGVTVSTRLRPSQLIARMLAINAIGLLIGWLT